MLTLSLCAYAFEEIVQWRYGAAGAIALGLVSLGHKVRNTTFTCIGLATLAILLAQ
jgi:hypothetical protein